MKATLLLDEREAVSENAFLERVPWLLPAPMPLSWHPYKYRLAYVVNDVCVVRYDNEGCKGDHRHVRADDPGMAYNFTTLEALLDDFLSDVERWKP